MDQNQTIKPNIKQILDQLNIFLDQLRVSGYKIGIDSCLRVPELISRLIATGNMPDNIQTLEQYLIALLCTSTREKADFIDRFATWIKTYEDPPKDQSTTQTLANRLKLLNRHAWELIVFFSALTIIIGTVTFLWNQKPIVYTILTPIDMQKDQKPLNQEIPFNQPEDITSNIPRAITFQELINPTIPINNTLTYKDIEKIGAIIAIFIIILVIVWVWWWYNEADRFLTHVSTDEDVIKETIYLKGYYRKLFQTIMMVRTARKFRRHYQIDSLRLDPNQTVAQTCDNGGQFTPVYGKIHVIPEYLVLIDRITYSDHQAGWIDSLLDRFVDNDVYLERYYFDGTPQMCFPHKTGARPIRLDHLLNKYPNHRVILFTDGDYFIDPFTGKPSSWLSTFNGWSEKAILMPGHEQLHVQRKNVLEHADFIVLPATETGLGTLIDHIQQDRFMISDAPKPTTIYPDMLRRNPGKWLDRIAPDDKQQIDMLNALKIYLGTTGYEWLCACAIFPKIDIQLTHFIGESVNLFNDHDLVNLSRLPWFRYNKMPDWLRSRLLNDLSDQHADKARETIKNLFLPGLDQGMALTISSYKSWFGKRFIKTVLKRLKKRQALENDLCDYIFLTFLNKPLSFKVSKQINKMMGRQIVRKKIMISLVSLFSIVLMMHTVLKVFESSHVKDTAQSPTINQKDTAQSPPINQVESQSIGKSTPSSFTNAYDMTFVWIKPGRFMMGSPKDELGRDNDENLHEVELTKGYYMQTTEVTQGQWETVMGKNPSNFKACGKDCPVETVSWDDVQEFIKRLNQLEEKNGFVYRLPTEAEWEYAARAGTKTVYNYGNKDSCENMNYENDPGSSEVKCVEYIKSKGLPVDSTVPVKNYSSNDWGLYDMHGNVWEWCQDVYGDYPKNFVRDPIGLSSGGPRFCRGGSWCSYARSCRSAYRNRYEPGLRDIYLGFRAASQRQQGDVSVKESNK